MDPITSIVAPLLAPCVSPAERSGGAVTEAGVGRPGAVEDYRREHQQRYAVRGAHEGPARSRRGVLVERFGDGLSVF